MAAITKSQLEQASIDANLLNRFRQGPSDETIPTEEGPKPTLAGIVKQSLLAASIETLTGFSFQSGATITANNQALLDTSTGEYFRWTAGLVNGSKVVPANSTPASTGGIGAGKWISVGDGALRSSLLSPSIGGRLIGYKFDFSGSRLRNIDDYVKERSPSVLDYGAEGDGVTDDTAAINAAIASASFSGGKLIVPKNRNGTERKYLVNWSNIVNPYGVEFEGDGAIVSAESVGGFTQRNLYGNKFKVSYGQEYLYRIYKRFELGQTAKVFLFGDSTVQGGNGEDAAYSTGTLLFDMFQEAGLSIALTNLGVAGTSWYQMNAVPQISTTSDLFIIKYGINDPGTPGSGDRLQNFAAAMRSKLAEIRASANGGKNNLSIILVGPNSTNDTQHNRDALWYEKIRNIYLKAARDFQCAYIDIYGMMPDVAGSSGFSLDDPFGTGQGVHPMNTFQCWIWGTVLDTFFNARCVEKYRSNGFVNVTSIAGSPGAVTSLINYRKGISIYRVGTSGGWPFEGSVKTERSADDVGHQKLVSFDKGSSKTVTRTWNTANNTWNAWTGIGVGLTIANGGTATVSPEVRVSVDGLVTISAVITGGTVTASTTILSGLPTYLRPAFERRFAQCNVDGSHISVGVNTSGNIFLVTAASASGFHVNLSYYI